MPPGVPPDGITAAPLFAHLAPENCGQPLTVEFFDDLDSSQAFTVALAKGVYYGPVYLRHQWPYMTLALAHTQRDAGVSVAEVDLKFICDMWPA
jgi:hypothetical protein